MSQQQDVLYESSLESLPLLRRGKVRDIYAAGDDHLLIVTTDRISAFDVILPDAIPGKGAVLTATSNFWFERTEGLVANHLSKLTLEDVLENEQDRDQVRGRAIVVDRLEPLLVEAVARGYIIGSGWKDYEDTGAVCGITLPAGLRQADQLAEPIYTPASKADVGDHDENIDFETTVSVIGRENAERIRDLTLRIYTEAAAYARGKGIIIADTKFEFATDERGDLVLIDEVLTPDSSRFWPASEYRVGISPPSFDKQFVRDYLETLDWDKRPPGPKLPEEIIQKTAAKYREAYERLTG
jgi:phosphoribosylaminoimidazole-succinocarboxamide synthase